MAQRGFLSTWLPLQQEHETGALAEVHPLRGDLHRGPMWTDAHTHPGPAVDDGISYQVRNDSLESSAVGGDHNLG